LRSVLKPILTMMETVLAGMPDSLGRNAEVTDRLRVNIVALKLVSSQWPIFYGGRIVFQCLMLMPLSTSYSIYILPVLFSVISLLYTVAAARFLRHSINSSSTRLHSELSSGASVNTTYVNTTYQGPGVSPNSASREKNVNGHGAASVGAASAKVAPYGSAARSVSS
jgi:hypothetical protein